MNHDDLTKKLKAQEAARIEHEQRRKAEAESIWRNIGGPSSLSSAPKAVKLMRSLLDYIVSGWYGIDARVSGLKQIGERAAALANMTWNTMNSQLRLDQERSAAIYLKLDALRGRVEVLLNGEDGRGGVLDPESDAYKLAEVLADLCDPDLFGFIDKDDYERMLLHWGEVMFHEAKSEGTIRSNPAEALSKHVNKLIHEHKDEIQANLADALVKKGDN